MNLFLAPSHPQLCEESFDVCPCDIATEEIQSLIDTMVSVAIDETQDQTKSIMVGLAAPQIGYQDRVILVDTSAKGVFTENGSVPPPYIKIMINPEILWTSEETVIWREGCYSTSKLSGLVPRAKEILVKYYDREGNILVEEYEGYVARIIQHEIDHLDGIRFPERVGADGPLHWVEDEELAQYRIHWMDSWPTVPWEKWLQVKHGNP